MLDILNLESYFYNKLIALSLGMANIDKHKGNNFNVFKLLIPLNMQKSQWVKFALDYVPVASSNRTYTNPNKTFKYKYESKLTSKSLFKV